MIIQIDLKISSYRIIIMDEIQVLKQENEELKNKIIELDERLKKYTAPARSKTYYENHKEELLEKMKKYKPTPEQIKERNKKAYLKRKEKMENLDL
jgi:hypothetical protein